MSLNNAIKFGILAAIANARKLEDAPPSPEDAWSGVIDYINDLVGTVNQLGETLDHALVRIEALETPITIQPVYEWTDKYFTSQKIGHVYEEPAFFDDIEILKGATPDDFPRIQSIEVSYTDSLFFGYKVNYAGVETETHMAKDGYIHAEHNDVYELEEGDYIVEMGARAGWALDAFWFKTKNGHEALYGNADGGSSFTCNTGEASNPMIIGFGMQDHIDTQWWDSMQALWCHYVDLADFQ